MFTGVWETLLELCLPDTRPIFLKGFLLRERCQQSGCAYLPGGTFKENLTELLRSLATPAGIPWNAVLHLELPRPKFMNMNASVFVMRCGVNNDAVVGTNEPCEEHVCRESIMLMIDVDDVRGLVEERNL